MRLTYRWLVMSSILLWSISNLHFDKDCSSKEEFDVRLMREMKLQAIQVIFWRTGIILHYLFMKRRSTSSHGSDKSQEGAKGKQEKRMITFEYGGLDCFMSSASQKPQKQSLPNPSKPSSRQLPKPDPPKEKEEQKSPFSQLRIPRLNRGKVPSNSHQAFNNSILLLEYENQEEPRMDSAHKSQRRESPKSEEEDQMVSAVVNSCMRVITEETQHSSNPITARYTTEPDLEQCRINHNYSASSIPYASSSLPYTANMPYAASQYPNSTMPMMMQMDGYYYNYIMKSPAVRNRRAISNQESRAYVIDVNEIEPDGRTTIMIRNIPNKYTQEMLLERFEENHKKKFDFFYLPIDYNNNCNVGYAFLNFIHTKFIEEFYREFHHRTWEKFNSNKVCQVCYARIQGTAQLEHHFEHSNVLQQKEKRYRPLIGIKSLTDNIQSLVNKQKEGQSSSSESKEGEQSSNEYKK